MSKVKSAAALVTHDFGMNQIFQMLSSLALNRVRRTRTISKSEYGDHNMVIYKDLNEFRKIYTYHTKEGLGEKNEIVLISSAYETPESVKSNLTNAGVDTRRHMLDGSLIIIDAMRAYHTADVYGLMKLLESLHYRGQKDGKSGVLCFGDVGTFFLLHKTQELADYESSIPNIVQMKLRAFCCYHKANFDTLSQEHKHKLLECHLRAL